jgi:hypothetical protein
LSQDWVLDVCDGYCAAQLDTKRLHEQRSLDNGTSVAPGRRRSSARFLINTSVQALHNKTARYTQDVVNTSNWTTDDHDVRFIVRLVQQGRCAGRWWENWCEAKHTGKLCCTAYQVLCWLRHIHGVSSGSSSNSRIQRVLANHWHALLTDARAKRRWFVDESMSSGGL